MPISFHCPSCGQSLSAPDAAAGQKGTCKFCHAALIAPAASGEAATLVEGGTPSAPPPAAAPMPPPANPFAPGPGAGPDPASTPASQGYAPPAYSPPGGGYTPPGSPGYTGASYLAYADPVKRLVAAIIDGLLLGLVGLPIGFALGVFNASPGANSSQSTVQFISVILGLVYYVAMESSNYQGTLGKVVMGIRVADTDGNRITVGKAILRYIGRMLVGFTCCIGYLMILFTEKKQGLHDIIAGTVVLDR